MGLIDKAVKLLWSPETVALEKATPRGVAMDDLEFEYTRERGIDYKTNRGTLEDYLQTYEVSAWVYICVSKKSNHVAQVPLKVWSRKPGSKRNEWNDLNVKEPNHPLVKLIQRPNPWTNEYDFKRAIVGNLELGGNTYIEMETDSKGFPVELYSLLPYRTKIVPDPRKFILGYLYEVSGQAVKFDVDSIMHFKYWHPRSQYYGLSPIQAAELSVITDTNAAVYNKNFFGNSAIPNGVVSTDQELSDLAYRRLKKMWTQAHSGIKQAHKIAILEGGLKWQQTGMNSKDMEFISCRKLSREEIMGIYGVPPVIAGIMEYASYSNSNEQKLQYWEDTIGPLLMLIERRLNSDLVSKFKNPDLYVEFDTSVVQSIKENRESEARVDASYVDRGIKTINEIRREKGLDDVDWGDVWYPTNAGGLSVDRAQEAKTQGGEAGDQFGSSKGENLGRGPKNRFYTQGRQPTKFPSQRRIGKSEEEDSDISPFQEIRSRLNQIP